MEDYELIDNREGKRYEFHIERFVPCIDYVKSGDDCIYLTHTEVPPPLEGKGVGMQLVHKSLTDIERQGLRVVPMCGFVVAYIKRHPEWERIVMDGINID